MCLYSYSHFITDSLVNLVMFTICYVLYNIGILHLFDQFAVPLVLTFLPFIFILITAKLNENNESSRQTESTESSDISLPTEECISDSNSIQLMEDDSTHKPFEDYSTYYEQTLTAPQESTITSKELNVNRLDLEADNHCYNPLTPIDEETTSQPNSKTLYSLDTSIDSNPDSSNCGDEMSYSDSLTNTHHRHTFTTSTLTRGYSRKSGESIKSNVTHLSCPDLICSQTEEVDSGPPAMPETCNLEMCDPNHIA